MEALLTSTAVTPVGMLLVALIAGVRGDWVFGREFRAMKQDRDDWKQIALEATSLTKRAVETKDHN